MLKSLKNNNLTVTEASSGISLMKGEEHEETESEDHEHGEFDPHVWLSPVNAKKEMENIKDAFVKGIRTMKHITRLIMKLMPANLMSWTKNIKIHYLHCPISRLSLPMKHLDIFAMPMA